MPYRAGYFPIKPNGTSDDLAESSLTDKELLNQFKSIEKLPEADKNVVKVFLDAFITKKKLKQLVLKKKSPNLPSFNIYLKI